MPTQWTLDLAGSVDLSRSSQPDILHAVCCAFFGERDQDHALADKPFSTRSVGQQQAITALAMTWLPDTTPPTVNVPAQIRLGNATRAVNGMRRRVTPADRLGQHLNGRRIRFTVSTPAHLRHHGRDYPLPDPYLIYTSLARRHSTAFPKIDIAEQARDLARAVVVYEHDIHTESFTWHGTRGAGFVGAVTFGIPAASNAATRALFNTLNGFANFAGIGHGTTHGLGATTAEVPAVAGTGAVESADNGSS